MNLLKINKNQCKNCQYLILLFATSFLPSDWEKYSLEELYKVAKQNHITIIIMDACKYFQPIAFRGESPVVFNEKQREIIQYEVIRTKKELSENIKYYADKSLFFPMFDDYYDVREFYSLARQYDLMYGYINGILGDISVVTESKSKKIGIGLFKTLFAPGKINSILYNRIFRRVFATCSRKGRGVFFAVAGKNKENEIMQNGNLLKNAKKIQTHTYDYERYLRWKRSIYDNENICPLKQPYMVFLDQYIPFHPDLKATGYSIDADTYYHNVEMILNHLSKELNLNIAIAAHPKANYEKLPYFAKYEIFYKDNELKLVITTYEGKYLIMDGYINQKKLTIYTEKYKFIDINEVEFIQYKNFNNVKCLTKNYEINNLIVNERLLKVKKSLFYEPIIILDTIISAKGV